MGQSDDGLSVASVAGDSRRTRVFTAVVCFRAFERLSLHFFGGDDDGVPLAVVSTVLALRFFGEPDLFDNTETEH